VGINLIQVPNTSVFPRQFCVVDLVNPIDERDFYPLAQLLGADLTNPFPLGSPNNPACNLPPA
jgi:hypothetical protein